MIDKKQKYRKILAETELNNKLKRLETKLKLKIKKILTPKCIPTFNISSKIFVPNSNR